MPIRNEVEAFVHRIILQPHPVLQRAEVMSDMQPARRPHATQNPTLLPFSPRRQTLLLFSVSSVLILTFSFSDQKTNRQECLFYSNAGEQIPRNDHPLDLAGALINGDHARIP